MHSASAKETELQIASTIDLVDISEASKTTLKEFCA
jgi:hypothetical protein